MIQKSQLFILSDFNGFGLALSCVINTQIGLIYLRLNQTIVIKLKA